MIERANSEVLRWLNRLGAWAKAGNTGKEVEPITCRECNDGWWLEAVADTFGAPCGGSGGTASTRLIVCRKSSSWT
jgi:hypothetical protein